MSNLTATPDHSDEKLNTPAQTMSVGARVRGRVLYLLIVAGLVGILKLGHATHWSIPSEWFTAVAVPAAKPASEEPAAPGKQPVLTPAVADTKVTSQEVAKIELDEKGLKNAGIELHSVTQRGVDEKLTAHGIVSYNKNLVAQLSTRVPGTVWRVEKLAGQPIRKGDVLAIVEALEVGRMKSELLQAVVTRDLRTRTVERMEAAEGVIPEKMIHEAKSEERVARIRVQDAIQSLVNLGLFISQDEIKGLDDAQLAKKLQFLGLPDSIVATLEPQTTTTNLLPLFAPFDGVVIGREITLGETVSPTESHFEVADIRRMWVTLEVRKEDVNLVRLGQTISFTADGIPGEVMGKVDWISTEVDENTRTLQVRAEVDNPELQPAGETHCEQRLLRAHTFGTGQITVRTSMLSTVVPNEAVQFDGRTYMVFVRDGQSFRRVPVKTGVVDRDMTEILSGLDAGVVVATEGSHVVKAEFQLVQSAL